jgi:hypothetical protein
LGEPKPVDGIDRFPKRVDKNLKFRHIVKMCRNDQPIPRRVPYRGGR